MGHVVDRAVFPELVTYLPSVNVTTIDYPLVDWIHNPDLSLLLDIIPLKYWKVVGDTVVEMTTAEKDEIDELEDDQAHHKDFSFDHHFIDADFDKDAFWGAPIIVGTSELINPKGARGGIVTLRSGGAIDDAVTWAMDGKAIMLARSFQLDIRAETPQLADSSTEFGLSYDNVTGFMTDEVIKFTRSGTGNWFARCISSATETAVDTGVVAIDTDYMHFRIKGLRDRVRFLIDGTKVAEINTNKPEGVLEIYISQKTTGGTAARNLRVDRVWGSSREA